MLDTLRSYTRASRRKKFDNFINGMSRPLRILDLGGTEVFWKKFAVRAEDGLDITLINNHHIDKENADFSENHPFIRRKIMSALEIPSEVWSETDLIFSNSFLEHLPSRTDQETLARSIIATGKPYFIQTPNKWSLIDPHFPHLLIPFFAAYPRAVQARLWTLHRFGSRIRAASLELARKELAYYNPLSANDLTRLFPDATLVREKTAFVFAPSLLVYQRPLR